jgi:hypothetical protein
VRRGGGSSCGADPSSGAPPSRDEKQLFVYCLQLQIKHQRFQDTNRNIYINIEINIVTSTNTGRHRH